MKKKKRKPDTDEVDIQIQIEDAMEDGILAVRAILEEQRIYFDDTCWNRLINRAAAGIIHRSTL